MKIRNGFVSNSSSSSFVVAFPKKPESVEEVHKMLFGQTEPRAFTCYGDEVNTSRIAQQVFSDVKEATVEEMRESLADGWFNGRIDDWEKTEHLDFRNPEERGVIQTIWKDYNKANDKIASDIIEDFRKNNKGSFFIVVNYGDDDGHFFSIMEHGGIFDKLKHIRTSYH